MTTMELLTGHYGCYRNTARLLRSYSQVVTAVEALRGLFTVTDGVGANEPGLVLGILFTVKDAQICKRI